jgi:hypothetical protein
MIRPPLLPQEPGKPLQRSENPPSISERHLQLVIGKRDIHRVRMDHAGSEPKNGGPLKGFQRRGRASYQPSGNALGFQAPS